jgi:diguanylate cyclase (GGDEF)-like protein/PAS domain S-box-containing protein
VQLRDRQGREVGKGALVHEADPLRDRYALASQASGDGMWDWDLATDRLWVSDAWRAIVGAGEVGDALAGWLDRVHAADREPLLKAVHAHLEGRSPRFESEHRLRHADGSWRWVLARGQATRDTEGKAVRLSGSLTDVTEPQSLAIRAVSDALTRLPNRTHFLELVNRSLARGRRSESHRCAVLFVDLDRFKRVNDALGHAAGDELLIEVGERIAGCLREGDVLSRPGADEFAILLEDLADASESEAVACRIHEALSKPFDVAGQRVSASASVGIAVSAPVYTRAEDLLVDADAAMYRAKALGGGRSASFDPGARQRAPHLVDLELELRHALARDEFRVHYLPIVDVATGRIQGLEALIRWAHPTRGLIPPEQFLPLADHTGLIVPMGRWLLAQAGREFRACVPERASGSLTLNVNLSSRQLQHPGLIEQIDGVATEHGLDLHDLVVELTESTLQDANGASAHLGGLRERGVRLSMDDFGTGSSSLSSLFRFQLDSLKIDRSLFTGGSPRGQAPELVRSIVAAAREAGTHVVAEGVETADQFGFLREVGCSAAQGFYFSPPVDGAMARSLLARAAGW